MGSNLIAYLIIVYLTDIRATPLKKCTTFYFSKPFISGQSTNYADVLGCLSVIHVAFFIHDLYRLAYLHKQW